MVRFTPRRRAWLSYTLTVLLVLGGMFAGSAAAVPATQTWTGGSATTPDIERDGLKFFAAGGSTITETGVAGTINFTLDGVPYVGFCTDVRRVFSLSPEPVDVVTENPPASADRRAVSWILLNRAPTGAQTPAKAAQAAASQLAVWILTDPHISSTNPTDEAPLNTAALALVAEARAATATASLLSLSASTPAAGGTTATISITGKPSAVVSLAISAGAGTLSASQVTLGSGGTGSVVLTSGAPGSVGVTATVTGDGRLLVITPTTAEKRLQPTIAAVPNQIASAVQATFRASTPTLIPSPGTLGTTTPALVPVAGAPSPRLSITKSAPPRSVVLQSVRYRITVRNSGKVQARNAVLRDVLPAGMSFVRSSRSGTLSKGTITFRLGTIAPGASRVVDVWLRANAGVRGSRVNTATVSATRVKPLSARAATLFRPLARRVQPAVTG